MTDYIKAYFRAYNFFMGLLRQALWLLLAIAFLSGCDKKKKQSLSGDDLVNVSDFISFFSEVAPPYQVSDSVFKKKDKDSLQISNKVFKQFVPDSVLTKVFGKGAKPKIYAIARVDEPGAGSYLFVKTSSGDKKAVVILAFGSDEKFISAFTALRPDNNSQTNQSAVFDKKFTITQNVIRKNADGTVSDGKDVYVLNAGAGTFTLIMTDALEEKVTELINPIDTLPRKHKYAADYGFGKMNLVSVRDGKKADRITFFVHFEKGGGNCNGELKGEAVWKTSTVAEYKESGDPCILKLTFSSKSVTISEENCGSRRTSLNCSFNGSFPRKKYAKTSDEKKSVKK